MSWVATCNFCGAPLLSGSCPRCKYRRPKQQDPRKGHVVFTAADSAAKIPAARFITSVIDDDPQPTAALLTVTVEPGESLLLFLFTNNGSDPLLGVPIFSGPPTWNGIDATSAGGSSLWVSSAEQTVGSSTHIFYWNQPGAGSASIEMVFDVGDTATTRMYWAVGVNTNDLDPANEGGNFHFPPNGPGSYSTPNGITIAGTQTGVHAATTDFANAVVFSACLTEQQGDATAGAWQGGFVRIHREGSLGARGGDITGDVAWKVFPTAVTAIGAQLSGFASAKWTHLSFENFL